MNTKTTITLTFALIVLFAASCSEPTGSTTQETNEQISPADTFQFVYYGEKDIKGHTQRVKKELPELIPYNSYGKWGYCNQEGEIVIPCEYSKTYFFVDGLGHVVKSGKHGVVNTNGELVVATKFYSIYIESGHILARYKYNKTGLLNAQGDTIVPFQFDDMDIVDEIAVARRGEKYGAFDFTGKIIIHFDFSMLRKADDKLLKAKRGEKYGIIGFDGKMLIPCRYTYINPLHDKNFIASRSGKMGVVDRNDKSVILFRYDALKYVNNYFLTQKSTGCGVINKFGDVVLPSVYEAIEHFEFVCLNIRHII
jgi:hypothetical protein